jgi:hypothetical protein
VRWGEDPAETERTSSSDACGLSQSWWSKGRSGRSTADRRGEMMGRNGRRDLLRGETEGFAQKGLRPRLVRWRALVPAVARQDARSRGARRRHGSRWRGRARRRSGVQPVEFREIRSGVALDCQLFVECCADDGVR